MAFNTHVEVTERLQIARLFLLEDAQIVNIVEFPVDKLSFDEALFRVIDGAGLDEALLNNLHVTESHGGAVVDRGECTISDALQYQWKAKFAKEMTKREKEANL